MKTPLSQVKSHFGDKSKLVEAVQALANADLWLDRLSETKGLRRVSNAKLMRLHRVLSAAKTTFGTRANLVQRVLELEKKPKDEGYQRLLEGYPLPRLLDAHRSAERRAKARATAPAKPKPRKVARSKRAQAHTAKASRKANQGKASQGKASQGKASQGKASQSKASQGKANQGKGIAGGTA